MLNRAGHSSITPSIQALCVDSKHWNSDVLMCPDLLDAGFPPAPLNSLKPLKFARSSQRIHTCNYYCGKHF